MTKLTPVLHRIHDLDGNICKADVEEIRRVISIVRATSIAMSAINGDMDTLESLILGPRPGSTDDRQLRSMSDAELLELWETQERAEAIEMRGDLAYAIELQIDAEATEITDWNAMPAIEIEGQEDGVMIQIDRDALISRLLAADLALQNKEPDHESPYLADLTKGMKGYQNFTIDELRSSWDDSRVGFYDYMEMGDLPFMMDDSDPEFGK